MPRLKSVSSHIRSVRLSLALALGATALSAGCSHPEPGSGPRVAVFPVSGQVQIEGEKADGAFVVFHSLAKTTPPAKATADADGRFKLSTYDTGDGAPAGEYAVTVELHKLVKQDGGGWGEGPNVLPEKFADPTTTPLKVTVASGPNDIPLVVKK